MAALPAVAMRALALVTDAFGGYGGISQFNRNLLAALSSFPGCDEVVAIVRIMPGTPEPLPPNLTYVTSAAGKKSRFVYEAIRAIRKGKYDFILCGHINLWPMAYALGKLSRTPAYLIIHGIEAWTPTRSLLANKLVGYADGYITVSNFTGSRFCAWTHVPPTKGFLLPNTYDPEKFKPGPKNGDIMKRHALSGRTVIMTLARLETAERFKGIDEVLQIIPRLLARFPDLRYIIAGGGTDRGRLEEKTRSLGLSSIVIFAGKVPEDEKADYYRLCDAYVMPGCGEGFGIAYLEALACGIPVVGSRTDGSREALLDGRLGWIVDPQDARELEEAIGSAILAPKGVVPSELEEFSISRFRERCHSITSKLISSKA